LPMKHPIVRVTVRFPLFFFFIFLVSISLIHSTQNGYAQTNLQELQNRVADLEKRLAKAKARQEKAYNVQMQLEEQEQKLAKLADSEKYKIQIIEIRADVENIRIRIEAIVKEKNDLEENLRLANNLLNILREAQTMNEEQQVKENTIDKPKSSIDQPPSASQQTVAKIEHADDVKTTYWKIQNININDQLYKEERSEINKNFKTNISVSQRDILESSYSIYKKTGAILNLLIRLKGNQDHADLDISLDRREPRNSNYSGVTAFNFYEKIKSFEEFKKEYFKISIVND